jgi:hypothetical protein
MMWCVDAGSAVEALWGRLACLSLKKKVNSGQTGGGWGVVERVPKTAPTGAVLGRRFLPPFLCTGTETDAVETLQGVRKSQRV